MRRALTAVAVALLLAGCGEITNTVEPAPGTANLLKVALGSAPNPTQSGLFLAQKNGYFSQTDLRVTLAAPSGGASALQQLESGQVQVAILSEPTVLLARNAYHPLVSVASLLQTPSSVVVVCTTGSGKKGARRASSPRCSARTAAADPAYAGAPSYNGLVLAVLEKTIVNHAPVLRRFIQAVARGYRAAQADPASAAAALPIPTSKTWNAKIGEQAVSLSLPGQFPAGHVWGWQNPTAWNAFGEWLHNKGELENPNAIPDASTDELLAGQGV